MRDTFVNSVSVKKVLFRVERSPKQNETLFYLHAVDLSRDNVLGYDDVFCSQKGCARKNKGSHCQKVS